MPRLLLPLFLAAAAGGAVLSCPSPALAETTCTGVRLTPTSDVPAALKAAPEGTTFCFGAGVYRLSAPLVPKSRSVLWGVPGAVLNGSRHVTKFERSGTHWIVRGQQQQFVPPTTGTCADGVYTGCHLPEAVFSDGRALRQVNSLSELRPGTFLFDAGADLVRLADDPTNRKIEITVSPAAIAGFSQYHHHVTVRGLTIEKFAASKTDSMLGAVRAGHDWVVEDNDIRLNSAAGVLVSKNTILRRNHLHHNGQYGFQGDGTGLRAEDNEVAYNNTAGFSPNHAAGGSKIVRSSDVVFRRNKVHDNAGPGLWTDGDNFKVLYEHNVLERNVGPGIFHEISADATIRYNTFRGNGTFAAGRSIWYSADLFIHTSKNVEVYNNTIEAGINGIGIVDYDRGSGPYGLREVRNVNVHHNTVTMRAGGQTGLVGKRSAAFSSAANNRFESNTYRVPDLSGRFWQWNGAKTIAEWKALGKDRQGVFLRL